MDVEVQKINSGFFVDTFSIALPNQNEKQLVNGYTNPIVRIFLSWFGDVTDIEDANGNIFCLESKGVRRWLKKQNFDDETIRCKGIANCIFELTKPKETIAAQSFTQNTKEKPHILFNFSKNWLLKKFKDISGDTKCAEIDFFENAIDVTQLKERDVLCFVRSREARNDDELNQEFARLTSQYGKKCLFLIILRPDQNPDYTHSFFPEYKNSIITESYDLDQNADPILDAPLIVRRLVDRIQSDTRTA